VKTGTKILKFLKVAVIGSGILYMTVVKLPLFILQHSGMHKVRITEFCRVQKKAGLKSLE